MNTAVRHFAHSVVVKFTILHCHLYFLWIYFNIIVQNKHNSAKWFILSSAFYIGITGTFLNYLMLAASRKYNWRYLVASIQRHYFIRGINVTYCPLAYRIKVAQSSDRPHACYYLPS